MKISLILIPNKKDISNILSILKQQIIKNFELVIVSDEEDEKIKSLSNVYKRYFDIKYVVAPKATSFEKKLNIGLLYRKYDIIGFLTADTIYKDNTTQFVINNLYSNPKGICVCNLNNYDIKDDSLHNIIFPDNYFINFQNEDIFLFASGYESRVKDIQYVERLVKKGFKLNYVNNYNIKSAYEALNIESSEYSIFLKNEILNNKRINLGVRYIKSLFKGEK